MIVKSLVTAAAALSLAAAPAAFAQEEVGAGAGAGATAGSFIIPLLAVSAILLGTYVAVEESEDEPTSP